MLIVITGSPATGKTEIARILAKKIDCRLIEIKKIVEKKIIGKKIKKEMSVSVNLNKLYKLILPMLKKSETIIEGHLSCEIPLPANYIFVLRCAPPVLRKRMEAREYSKKKIEENLMAEMLDYCTQKAFENYAGEKIIEVETSKRSLKKSVDAILSVIYGKNKKIDNVSYNKYLMQYLGLK